MATGKIAPIESGWICATGRGQVGRVGGGAVAAMDRGWIGAIGWYGMVGAIDDW